jgi:O-antigen/teichoic acid export membrane protein
MLSASWIAKALGLLSTVILARILTPEDFGLVAITMLVVHFLDVFANTGTQQFLLSKDEVDDDDLNTAWSLNMLFRIFTTLALLALAEPIANFFEADLTNAFRVSALILIIIGLTNPALSMAKRAFHYQGIFKLALLVKFISFTITITIAYYTHSYWALIIGTISHYAINAIGSYFIYPFMPKFCLKNINEQWDYSKWILLRSFAGYTRSKGDAFIISKFFSTSDVGVFTIAKEFAMLVYEQIATPVAEIIMTSVQQARKNNTDISYVIEKYFLILLSLILPIACIISLYADHIVVIILGDKWLSAAPILEVLTLLGISTSLTMVFNSTLTALKLTKLTFKVDVVTTVIILSTLFLLKGVELADFALIRSLLDLVVLVSYFVFTKFIIGLSLRSCIKNLIPTLFSVIALSFLLNYLDTIIIIDSFITLSIISGICLLAYGLFFWGVINFYPYSGKALFDLKCSLNQIIKNKTARLSNKYYD